MSAPSLSSQAAKAGEYPNNFSKREQRLLESVKDYVDNAAFPDGSIGTAELADDSVTKAKLAPSIEFSHMAVAAGSFTTAGGDANESITVAGALSSDIAIVMIHTAGATPRSIVSCAAASGAINIVFSGDPSTDHVLRYVLIRAAS
jgi:hypothetical protein